MGSTCVVGLQWGDEAKGKIVDLLCDQHDVVVRYQGGANAGHTVVHDGVTYKLSLVPTGMLRPGIDCVIGNGVVIHPPALLKELSTLAAQGVDVGDRLPHQRPGPRHPALSPGRGAADRGIGRRRRPHRHHPPRDRALLPRQGRPRARRPDGRSLPPGPVPRTAGADRRLQEPAARRPCSPISSRSMPAPWPRSTSIMPIGSGRSSATRRPGCTAPSSRAAGCCSKAPRARCWTSTTAAIPT